MTNVASALATFDAAIAKAKTSAEAYSALQELTRATVGAKLFTVTMVDTPNEQACRTYTSDPENYPVSGTKPFNYGPWFDTVHGRREYFVANTIEDIAQVFFDHELINSLGCQSVVNMPVIIGDEIVASVNMLDVTGHFTPERVETIRQVLSIPAKLAVAIARD
jgi:hypothetical protein